MKKQLLPILFILFFFWGARLARAAEQPLFPTCSNPQGTLRVSYDGGSHAIVGEEGLREGEDKVYEIDGQALMQCFCAEDGEGIQTNWWKADLLSQEEIDGLVKLGWYYIPSGVAWGLESSPYLAENRGYICRADDEDGDGGSGQGGLTPAGAPVCGTETPEAPRLISVTRDGDKALLSWTEAEKATHYMISYGTGVGSYDYGVANTGKVTSYEVGGLDPNQNYCYVVYAVNDCAPSSPSVVRCDGSGGQVLGWASTGNMGRVVALLSGGLTFLVGGLLLRFKRS